MDYSQKNNGSFYVLPSDITFRCRFRQDCQLHTSGTVSQAGSATNCCQTQAFQAVPQIPWAIGMSLLHIHRIPFAV